MRIKDEEYNIERRYMLVNFYSKIYVISLFKIKSVEVVKPHSSAQYGICMKDQGIDLH